MITHGALALEKQLVLQNQSVFSRDKELFLDHLNQQLQLNEEEPAEENEQTDFLVKEDENKSEESIVPAYLAHLFIDIDSLENESNVRLDQLTKDITELISEEGFTHLIDSNAFVEDFVQVVENNITAIEQSINESMISFDDLMADISDEVSEGSKEKEIYLKLSKLTPEEREQISFILNKHVETAEQKNRSEFKVETAAFFQKEKLNEHSFLVNSGVQTVDTGNSDTVQSKMLGKQTLHDVVNREAVPTYVEDITVTEAFVPTKDLPLDDTLVPVEALLLEETSVSIEALLPEEIVVSEESTATFIASIADEVEQPTKETTDSFASKADFSSFVTVHSSGSGQAQTTDEPIIRMNQSEAIQYISELTTQVAQRTDQTDIIRSRIQLTPETLGEMTVELELENNELVGRIFVASDETKVLLEEQLQQMSRSLVDSRQLNVQRIDIQVQPVFEAEANTFDFHGGFNHPQQRSENKKMGQNGSLRIVDQKESLSPEPLKRTKEVGRLNLFV